MGTFAIIVAVIAIGFFALTMGMQVVLRSRVAALKGTAVPDLPGGVGERISSAKPALVCFYSQQCGACRPITPRVRELRKHNNPEYEVFAIDVMQGAGSGIDGVFSPRCARTGHGGACRDP